MFNYQKLLGRIKEKKFITGLTFKNNRYGRNNAES